MNKAKEDTRKTKKGIVMAVALNVRKTNDHKSDIIHTLGMGKTVQIIGEKNGMVKTEHGWVNKRYIKII